MKNGGYTELARYVSGAYRHRAWLYVSGLCEMWNVAPVRHEYHVYMRNVRTFYEKRQKAKQFLKLARSAGRLIV